AAFFGTRTAWRELFKGRCFPIISSARIGGYLGLFIGRSHHREARDAATAKLFDDHLCDSGADELPIGVVAAPMHSGPKPRDSDIVSQATELLAVARKELDQEPCRRRAVGRVAGRISRMPRRTWCRL